MIAEVHDIKVVKSFSLGAPGGMVRSKKGAIIKAAVQSIPAMSGQEVCLMETPEGFRGIVPWACIRYAEPEEKPEGM